MANVKTRCAKGGTIRSVTPTFPGAAIYERELIDLLGASVEGIPEGPRYPLPEDWPAGSTPSQGLDAERRGNDRRCAGGTRGFRTRSGRSAAEGATK